MIFTKKIILGMFFGFLCGLLMSIMGFYGYHYFKSGNYKDPVPPVITYYSFEIKGSALRQLYDNPFFAELYLQNKIASTSGIIPEHIYQEAFAIDNNYNRIATSGGEFYPTDSKKHDFEKNAFVANYEMTKEQVAGLILNKTITKYVFEPEPFTLSNQYIQYKITAYKGLATVPLGASVIYLKPCPPARPIQ